MKTRLLVLGTLSALVVLSLVVAAVAWRSPAAHSNAVSRRRAARHHHLAQRVRQRHVAPALPADGPYLHTDIAVIRDASGQAVRLSGINWFGLETCAFAPGGLWARNWRDMMVQIKNLGFNTIRLPFSNQLFDPASQPNGIDYALNPDLKGLSGLQIMDKIVNEAGVSGLKILLDQHRPDCGAQSPLWYTDHYPETRWIADWVLLAERYAGHDAVIGADLHNEPHGPATWGNGNPATDWRLAAERAGDAILRVNPHWLIVVEGVEHLGNDWYWWGGNLANAGRYPVRLSVPHRLVYSVHDYGPEVNPQSWFAAPDFPRNLTGLWDRTWGYVQEQGIAPVLVGEFGGKAVDSGKEGAWIHTLVSYIHTHNLSFTYWCLNPNSGDTGGILEDDWTTVNTAKMALLRNDLAPLIGTGEALMPATSQRAASSHPTRPHQAASGPERQGITPERRPSTTAIRRQRGPRGARPVRMQSATPVQRPTQHGLHILGRLVHPAVRAYLATHSGAHLRIAAPAAWRGQSP